MGLLFTKLLVAVVTIYLCTAVILIASQRVKSNGATNNGLDFSSQNGEIETSLPTWQFTARDNTALNYRQYGDDQGPLIVVVHGSSAHGGLYKSLALGLSAYGKVVVPDLRGHGVHEPAGDVEYIGQLEDDLSDLIAATQISPAQKVVLVGHSSGGGLVVRYAGGSEKSRIDGAVLLAPYLGHNAPTTLPQFEVLVGSEDEAFLPSEFEPLLESFDNKGQVQIFPGLSHLGVIGDQSVHARIVEFIQIVLAS